MQDQALSSTNQVRASGAERTDVQLPVQRRPRAQGYGRKGTQALLLALKHLNDVNR